MDLSITRRTNKPEKPLKVYYIGYHLFKCVVSETDNIMIYPSSDMDGRLIMGQPIKCRWAKNKTKEQERLMRLEKEKQALLAEQKDPNDPNDPNNLNQNAVAPEELTANSQQIYHRSASSSGRSSQSALGFLSRMKSKKAPALEANIQIQDIVDNDDKSDGDTEYW